MNEIAAIVEILQSLSTPVLVAFGWIGIRVWRALNAIDRRLLRVEIQLGLNGQIKGAPK